MGTVINFKTRAKAEAPDYEELPGETPDDVLKFAHGKLASVIIVGRDHAGDGFLAIDVREDGPGIDLLLGLMEDLVAQIDGKTGPPGRAA